MPRAAPTTASQADDQEPKEEGTVVIAQQDPGNGFDDLRRNNDDVNVPSQEGEPEAQPKPGVKWADDSLADLTQKMRNRLMRDRKNMEGLLATKETEFNGTISALQARIDRLEKSQQAGTSTTEEDSALVALEGEMTEALEKGDSKTVAALNRKMAEKAAAKARHVPDEPQDLEPPRREPVRQIVPTPSAKYPMVRDWVAEQPWWSDPDKAHVRSFISKPGEGLDSKLQAAGYSPNEEAYFVELDRILEEKFPGVVVKKADRRRDEFSEVLDDDDGIRIRPKSEVTRRKVRQSAPVGGADDGANQPDDSQPSRPGSLRISAEDVANMRRFGMDPRDPKVVKGYIENRGDGNG